MKYNYLVLTINLIILGLLLALFFRTEYAIDQADKKAYVINQEIYQAFHARTDLEKKLLSISQTNRQKLDSMKSLLLRNNGNESLKNAYEKAQLQFTHEEKTIAEQYQMDLWKQINEYVSQFGQERGYEFIFGATGDGNLMYANNAKNVTKELIQYMNDHYEDKL